MMMKAYDQNVEAMVDVVLLDQLGIEASQKQSLTVALTAFNMLQAFSSKESIPVQKITREVLISRIAGKKVSADEVARARRHVQGLLKSVDQPSPPAAESTQAPRKRRAARRGYLNEVRQDHADSSHIR
jgi:hypothetical protein